MAWIDKLREDHFDVIEWSYIPSPDALDLTFWRGDVSCRIVVTQRSLGAVMASSQRLISMLERAFSHC